MKVADIKNVAGIGGGVIGGSWAVLFAMKGLNVKLYDINDDSFAHGKFYSSSYKNFDEAKNIIVNIIKERI